MGAILLSLRRPLAERRKLAATLAADVVGFSRLIGAGEDRTLARLRGFGAAERVTQAANLGTPSFTPSRPPCGAVGECRVRLKIRLTGPLIGERAELLGRDVDGRMREPQERTSSLRPLSGSPSPLTTFVRILPNGDK
jgi:hypothetical protein